ncbi:MAG: hypothetical protein NVSMB32_09210 [Actinomycetota bacterium]
MNKDEVWSRGGSKQVSVPEEVHRQLRILAAQRDTSVRDLVAEAVSDHFGIRPEEEARTA